MSHHKPSDDATESDSMTRRGEDIAKDAKEPGRQDTATRGETERPTGTSTGRDFTSVDPQDPQDGGSPAG